jgi:tRNA 2-thiocytidine biosynthesis protein TtcA
MIEAGDKVMVCLSGGKDSYALLDILLSLRERAPVPFDLVAVNLDQKQPGFPAHVLPDYLKQRGVPFHIENQDTYSIVKRSSPRGRRCAACARACAAASSTAWPANWARPRSRSATTATTWW